MFIFHFLSFLSDLSFVHILGKNGFELIHFGSSRHSQQLSQLLNKYHRDHHVQGQNGFLEYYFDYHDNALLIH